MLYLEFVGLVQVWGRWVYRQPDLLWRYGLEFSQRSLRELLGGLSLSAASLVVVLAIEGWLGWLTWRLPTPNLPVILLEGLAIGLAFGFAEELLFRGWLLDELQRDYSPRRSLGVSAIVFAALHFIRPLAEIIRLAPQFPALVLLGMALVWAKRAGENRLALPIGIHGGLVGTFYTLTVGKLLQFSDRAPEWITGIDRNPLAGVMGVLFLGGLALILQQAANRSALRRPL